MPRTVLTIAGEHPSVRVLNDALIRLSGNEEAIRATIVEDYKGLIKAEQLLGHIPLVHVTGEGFNGHGVETTTLMLRYTDGALVYLNATCSESNFNVPHLEHRDAISVKDRNDPSHQRSLHDLQAEDIQNSVRDSFTLDEADPALKAEIEAALKRLFADAAPGTEIDLEAVKIDAQSGHLDSAIRLARSDATRAILERAKAEIQALVA